MTKLAGDRYIVISSDGHAGAQVHEYRDYLESKYHDEFDAWEATFVNPFEDLRADFAYRNWDSAARLRELEDDGVVAEVLFPNTIPPFFPSGNLLARPPADDEYELRWAGLQRAQPLVGRLLRRHAGPARRDGAGVPQRRRRRGRRGRMGRGRGTAGGHPPAGRAPRLGAAADLHPHLRPLVGRVPGPRHADQQPQRRRRSGAGDGRHRHGRLHGRTGVVLAPRLLAHGDRRRVRAVSRHQADPHRAVERMGARAPSTCSTTSSGASATPTPRSRTSAPRW